MTTSNTYGKQVVVPLTNKSGGGVVLGDVVVIDTTNNDAFTTTTSGATTQIVGIAAETIASNAVGRVVIGGYISLVNVNASVTRGHYGATHTVAKQATDAGASRGVGTFCEFLTGGTTPDAMIFNTDLLGSSLTNPMTTAGDVIVATTGGTPTRLGIGADSTVLTISASTHLPVWQAPSAGITQAYLGYNTIGGSTEASAAKQYMKAVTPANAGQIVSVGAYIKGNASNVTFGVAGIMDDNAGAPGKIVAASDFSVFITTTQRWVDVAVSYYAAASTQIWLAIALIQTGNFTIYYDTSGTDYTKVPSGQWLDDVGGNSSGSNKYSIRASQVR